MPGDEQNSPNDVVGGGSRLHPKLVHVVHHVPSWNREAGISPTEKPPHPELVRLNTGEATPAGSPSDRDRGSS
jgi:hypothetical protein